MVILLAVLHAMVDAACAAKLYSAAGSLSVIRISSWFLLYNLLAFSTQAVIGGILDAAAQRQAGLSLRKPSARYGHPDLYLIFAVSGGLIVALGTAISFPLPAAICLIGLGNSIFHAGGGGYTLSVSAGKASGVGLFVGPGSLGLALGILFPSQRLLFVIGLTITAMAVILQGSGRKRLQGEKSGENIQKYLKERSGYTRFAGIPDVTGSSAAPWTRVAIASLLCFAVAFRAFGGSFPIFSWKNGTTALLVSAGFVMAGKITGGYAFDRFGAVRTIIVSSCLAAPVIALFSGNAPASLAGMFALNIAMPVTLVLLYRCLPKYPGFTFGLAAGVLFPGSLLGQIAVSGLEKDPLWVSSGIFICCSLAALLAVLASCMFLTRLKKKEEVLS